MLNPSVENTFIVFVKDIRLILKTHQISLCKNNSCVLQTQIEHSFVLVIWLEDVHSREFGDFPFQL